MTEISSSAAATASTRRSGPDRLPLTRWQFTGVVVICACVGFGITSLALWLAERS